MARFGNLGLTAVMLFLGLLLIVGSLLASIGTTLFPFDQYIGTRATVAGVTFGAGIMLAAMRPQENVTWVRLAIVYCGLEVIYEIFSYFWLGPGAFNLIPFIVSIIFGVLLIVLYPHRGDLIPRETPSKTAASAV
jgi:peptidoglycan/LPS O-acetylase OafA/YrhL